MSGSAFSQTSVNTDTAQPRSTIETTRDVRVNLIWTPCRLVDYAGEMMWGSNETRHGAEGAAWRFQFSITFRFN